MASRKTEAVESMFWGNEMGKEIKMNLKEN